MQLIGLLDCNNFFVSCERLFRPDVQARPVVVLSGNDGCVVARSNEVKDLGVPMGVPYFQVRAELTRAKATVFSSNFTLYRDISRRVMQLLASEVEVIERYSIDEAFFTLHVPDVAAAEKRLRELKATIEQQVGVPVSLGAARSKTIAKLASEQKKRGSGVCVLVATRWQELAATTALAQVWGVGGRLAERFRTAGLHTVGDFLTSRRERVAALYGLPGCRLYDELSEQAVSPVGERAANTQKSIMSTRSFRSATHERSVVADALSYHVHQAASELRELGLQCRYLQIIARASRHSDWALRPGTAELLLAAPTSDTRVLLRHAETLLEQVYEADVPYKKAGVILGGFSESGHAQPDLFGELQVATEQQRVMTVMDSINEQFAGDVIAVGRRLSAGEWSPARDWLSPHYTTNWSDIATVQA